MKDFLVIGTLICLVLISLPIIKYIEPSPAFLCALEVDHEGCLEYMRKKPPYENVRLSPDVLYVSSRRWSTHGLEWLIQDGSTRVKRTNVLTSKIVIEKYVDFTILVHGFRGIDKEIEQYFDDFISFISDKGGYHGKIVVFYWPSTARSWLSLSHYEQELMKRLATRPSSVPVTGYLPGEPNPNSGFDSLSLQINWESAEYNEDKRKAKEIGAPSLVALIDFLHRFTGRATLNIVGHSMGCYVIQQALLEE